MQEQRGKSRNKFEAHKAFVKIKIFKEKNEREREK